MGWDDWEEREAFWKMGKKIRKKKSRENFFKKRIGFLEKYYMPNVTHTRKGKQTIHVGYIVERNSKWHFGIDISSANFFGDDERNNSKNNRSYNCNIHSKEMILFIKHRKREKRNDKIEKKRRWTKWTDVVHCISLWRYSVQKQMQRNAQIFEHGCSVHYRWQKNCWNWKKISNNIPPVSEMSLI